MSFSYRGNKTNETTKENTTQVDWKAYNEYVVKTAQLEQRETLVGVISMIVDLGLQQQEDSKVAFTGTKEEELSIIVDNPNTYFEDGFDWNTRTNSRMKCWKNKPQQCVAIAVDFPDIILDKGQFFGESKPMPLRLWLGGVKFDNDTRKMLIQRPSALKVVNLDKTRNTKKWSLSTNNALYNMAVGAKLINNGEPFLPDRIGELLGKALQFECQVYFNEGKDGKLYFNEYIKYKSSLGRGQVAPTLPYTPTIVNFDANNDVNIIKEIRSHVINTIMIATDYEASLIKNQIEQMFKEQHSSDDDTESDDVDSPVVDSPVVNKQPTVKQSKQIDDCGIPF